ncbi:MAG: LL-diaminopimelate aminotransferase [Clostridiales bacterium]|jgi:LL-diaminopimelate aminotransferase|nr:LL-diaminopimelate aminotransferase [Clostridiales bacterium]
MKINDNYSRIKSSYLFTEIAKRVSEFSLKHPGKEIIRLGIGDVTRPLVPAVIDAMQKATLEMGSAATFRGYGEEQGYEFLRAAIAAYYGKKNVDLGLDEIFVSDGAKSDIGNILDLFDNDNIVLITDPVYPVYVDTNIMSGRKIRYLRADESNDFLPLPDGKKADIIYLCSPNNPTGAAYTAEQLKVWVDYATDCGAVILFDAAYESFVSGSLPTSIYQIEGAKKCAIEFCSLSKTAGFTGTRCGYTVVPKELVFEGAGLNSMWLRRQTTKFNGVAYVVQRGAEAVFSAAGQEQVRKDIEYYKENASIISEALKRGGIKHWGGVNSPYIWLKCPGKMTSWEYFDFLLEGPNIVGTPGSGFGENGEGYFRLTAFNTKEKTQQAMERLLSCAKAT